jgi:hypothetical protein
MKPKRNKRRLKREAKLGPEVPISVFSVEKYVLECGHLIFNPKIEKTTHMRQPKFYRCEQCRIINENNLCVK